MNAFFDMITPYTTVLVSVVTRRIDDSCLNLEICGLSPWPMDLTSEYVQRRG